MRGTIRFLFLILTMLFSPFMSMRGETVSRRQGEELAKKFFERITGKTGEPLRLAFDGRSYTTQRLFPPFYVFNHPEGGFVIVSGDNKAFPILGYSFKGSFSKEIITEAMKDVMERYGREIEYIRYDGRLPQQAISRWLNVDREMDDILSNKAQEDWFNMTVTGMSDDIRMRFAATEFPVLEIQQPMTDEAEDFPPPFTFYEDFIMATGREREEREREFQEKLIPKTPLMVNEGGGRYRFHFPEEVVSERIYNISGAVVSNRAFPETQTLFVSVEKETPGVYVLSVTGMSGRAYSFKLINNK